MLCDYHLHRSFAFVILSQSLILPPLHPSSSASHCRRRQPRPTIPSDNQHPCRRPPMSSLTVRKSLVTGIPRHRWPLSKRCTTKMTTLPSRTGPNSLRSSACASLCPTADYRLHLPLFVPHAPFIASFIATTCTDSSCRQIKTVNAWFQNRRASSRKRTQRAEAHTDPSRSISGSPPPPLDEDDPHHMSQDHSHSSQLHSTSDQATSHTAKSDMTRKPQRNRPTPEQLDELRKLFETTQHPSTEQRTQLAERIGMCVQLAYSVLHRLTTAVGSIRPSRTGFKINGLYTRTNVLPATPTSSGARVVSRRRRRLSVHRRNRCLLPAHIRR